MLQLKKHLEAAKKAYDSHTDPLRQIRAISIYCLEKLHADATSKQRPNLEGKAYVVLAANNAGLSRPILKSLFLSEPNRFADALDRVIKGIDRNQRKIVLNGTAEDAQAEINQVIYTAVMGFAACFDLWMPSSRKTPGTFFEIVLGSLLKELLPMHVRSKHVPLTGTSESVSTDIVFDSKDKAGLIFPAKITTRERIVQPFAHQRILDSYFGEKKRYRSIICCISETQRDDVNDRVNDICVPGTIKLFQQHLAAIDYLCYADPPTRYQQEDVTKVIGVKTFGWLLTEGLATLSA
jgi:hypothetical protein